MQVSPVVQVLVRTKRKSLFEQPPKFYPPIIESAKVFSLQDFVLYGIAVFSFM